MGGKRQKTSPLSTDTVTPYDRQAFIPINLLSTIVIEHFMGLKQVDMRLELN